MDNSVYFSNIALKQYIMYIQDYFSSNHFRIHPLTPFLTLTHYMINTDK